MPKTALMPRRLNVWHWLHIVSQTTLMPRTMKEWHWPTNNANAKETESVALPWLHSVPLQGLPQTTLMPMRLKVWHCRGFFLCLYRDCLKQR